MSKIVSDIWMGMVLECEEEEAGSDTETRPAVNERVKNESEGVDGSHREASCGVEERECVYCTEGVVRVSRRSRGLMQCRKSL